MIITKATMLLFMKTHIFVNNGLAGKPEPYDLQLFLKGRPNPEVVFGYLEPMKVTLLE